MERSSTLATTQLESTSVHKLLERLRDLQQQFDNADALLIVLHLITLRLKSYLEQLAAWDEERGYLTELAIASPHLSQELSRLRDEHERLRSLCENALSNLARPLGEEQIHVKELWQMLESLVQQLNTCDEHEDVLLYKALSQKVCGAARRLKA
jgi:hemerythrin-like domain-containing protein